jgi:hypothetical protein
MQRSTRIEILADSFWVATDMGESPQRRVGPFPTREEAKVQEIIVRMELRLAAMRALDPGQTRLA